MSQEMPAVSKDREDYTANEEKLKNLGGKNIADMSDDEAETFLAERKKIKGANEDIKDKAFDEAGTENQERDAEKAKAEAAAQEATEVTRQEQTKKDEEARQADVAKAAMLAEQIKGGGTDTGNIAEFQESQTMEDIYGMSIEGLATLVKSRGYTEELNSKDPAFSAKFQKFAEHKKSFEQARVKLFDRVLSGEATEDEVKIAADHATEIGKTFDLSGFHSAAPKAWYSDDRIAEAISATSPENRKWVESVRKSYSNERLRKQVVKIEDDGSVATYEPKGGI